jgi:hypothetical protein
MPDEPILREQARAAIKNGKLPARAPDRTWGGPGVDAECAVRRTRVSKSEKEFQIECKQEGGGALDKYHVHIRCLAAWEFERQKPPAP